MENMRITYGCCSDRGDVRTENQDRVLALSGEVEGKEAGLFVLADGMGGLEHLPRGRKIVYGAVKLKSGSPPI